MSEINAREAVSAIAVAVVLTLSLPLLGGRAQARGTVEPASRAICPVRSAPSHATNATLASSAAFGGYNQGIDMRDDEGYNSDYLFAMTRGVASSAITPAVKPLLFLFTVPLDIVLLPFTAIGGFF